ncbi:MAG: GMC family oxidoreductase [Gammaproteobacteria bacterium]
MDWRLSDIDKEGIRRAHRLIAVEVGRSGFDRMRIDLPDEDPELLKGAEGVCHHMGTTRMHPDPRLGVVDANCRIHGLENIFIAGSSVFATSGYANPTLTIVALALRLADRVRNILLT